MYRYSYHVLSAVCLVMLLSGCAATVTALKYKDLDVQTRMSDTIFLEPIMIEQKTVWLDVKSTADQPIDLGFLREALTSRGYRVLGDPHAAHYRLQVHVLYVGKAEQAAIDQSLHAGYGGALGGVLGGATAGAVLAGSGRGALIGAGIGGLLASGAELVAGSLVKAVTYSVIVDAQLSERTADKVAQVQTATLIQGNQTTISQRSNGTSAWHRYRTRVVATAVKTNLQYEEARPALEAGIARSIAGML